eukprot:SAG22_NODE_2208_length_2835_cov_4.717836_1_plen_23_part_10
MGWIPGKIKRQVETLALRRVADF